MVWFSAVEVCCVVLPSMFVYCGDVLYVLLLSVFPFGRDVLRNCT